MATNPNNVVRFVEHGRDSVKFGHQSRVMNEGHQAKGHQANGRFDLSRIEIPKPSQGVQPRTGQASQPPAASAPKNQ